MFAGSVMLGDLSDFIAPSQACVNPILTRAAAVVVADGGGSGGHLTLSLDYDDAPPISAAPSKGGLGLLAATSVAVAEPQRPDLIKVGAGNKSRVQNKFL